MTKLVDTGFLATDVQPDNMQTLTVHGVQIVVVRVGDKIFAFNGRCPHASADLSAGSFSRWKVSCPDHGYCFDVRNGRILWPEDELYRLKRYPVQLDGQRVLLEMEA